jgi:uncharacterized phage-associated protein
MECLVFLLVVMTLFFVFLYKRQIIYVFTYSKFNAMAYEPTTIANYFIQEKSSLGKLTPMKVIKLTYLSYSWYLALSKGELSLLNEKPQAWKYGPVFSSLYDRLKKNGKLEIQSKLPTHNEEVITNEISLFLDKIWGKYGKFTGVELSAMTHADGTPWDESYIPSMNNIISDDMILKHYSPKLTN